MAGAVESGWLPSAQPDFRHRWPRCCLQALLLAVSDSGAVIGTQDPGPEDEPGELGRLLALDSPPAQKVAEEQVRIRARSEACGRRLAPGSR